MFTPTASPKKKKLRFASAGVLGETNRCAGSSIDWLQCCICRGPARPGDPLICPADNIVSTQRYAGYKTLDALLPEFKAEGLLPRSIDLQALQGEAASLKDSLTNNRAKYHDSCRALYTRQVLTRQKAKKNKENSSVKTESFTPSPSTPLLGKRSRTPQTPVSSSTPAKCLLCGEGPTWKHRLVQLSTMNVEDHIIQIGKSHPNPDIRGAVQGVVSQGSLLKKDVKIRYHNRCLQNCISEITHKEESLNGMRICEAITFAEIVHYIQDEMLHCDSNVVFKASVLGKMYNDRLGALLGVHPSTLPAAHSTRLRRRILDKVTDLEERMEGREYCLIPSKSAFLDAVMENDMDNNGIIFDRFVRLIRKELEAHTCHFTGKLSRNCQEESVPPVLLAMCCKILFGSIPTTMNRSTQPAVTLAQLILFNFKKYRREESSIVRHQKYREPPLPVFLGLSTWGRTRMRGVVDTSHSLGLSVSSFRVREITSALCQWVVDRAEHDKVVIPANLLVGVFTFICYDNIDWNPTSNTSTDSFHGTAMSVLQMPTAEKPGSPVKLTPPEADFAAPPKRVPDLPSFYSPVPKIMLASQKPLHTTLSVNSEEMYSKDPITAIWKKEEKWFSHVTENYRVPLKEMLNFSWSGFHASESSTVQPGISSLLPLFEDDSSDVAMVVHGMRVAQSTVQHLNSGQTTPFCCDQPLFATAKIVQWSLPEEFPESDFFVMFGPFHIEQNFLRMLGVLLEGCGLVKVLASTDFYTEQSVQALLAVNSVKKSRAMHHVLASVLYILLREAYTAEKPAVTFEKWLEERAATSDLFYYWLLVLNTEVLLFRFIWSLRTRTYSEYCEALKAMLPLFFALDRHKYARWLSVHVKDIVELPTKAPNLHREFQNGNFSFPISSAQLSCVGCDQVHEQNNKIVKGDGGAIGLMQDPDALRRWMIAGPEVQRLLQDFEGGTTTTERVAHHEQYPAFQENCRKLVSAVKEAFVSCRNPFLESPKELLEIDTMIVVGDEGSLALRRLEEAGRQQYSSFVEQRLCDRKVGLYDRMKLNNFRIFSSPKKKVDGRLVSVKALEADVELFSRLYMMAGSRQLDYHEFFRYENQSCPPSLSKNGSLYPHDKADLIPILEKVCPVPHSKRAPAADTILFDGPALVYIRPPQQEKTFGEYWPKTLRDHVTLLQNRHGASRVDIPYDLYVKNSIKQATRDERGAGKPRGEIIESTRLPTKTLWKDFLLNDGNKAKLFRLLAHASLMRPPVNALLVTNVGDTIVRSAQGAGNHNTLLAGITCGDMEEADGRLMLHLADAVEHGCRKAVIRSVDTDVLVLAISYSPEFSRRGLQELWLHMGTDKTQKYLACHLISKALGPEKSQALRGFHSFTGCDFTSGFRGKRKPTCWTTWTSAGGNAGPLHTGVFKGFFAYFLATVLCVLCFCFYRVVAAVCQSVWSFVVVLRRILRSQGRGG